LAASVDLENCTRPNVPKVQAGAFDLNVPLSMSRGAFVVAKVETELGRFLKRSSSAHRQDSKGTRWMPWHQETMKDVDGCDKPR
jgi:hypothetical protein